MELGHHHIHRRLAQRVRTGLIYAELGDEVVVCHARRDRDDLLGVSFEDQRHEEVEQVDVADDVGRECSDQIVGEMAGICAKF